MRIAIKKALTAHVPIAVPTAVIAESTTGDPRRDAPTNRVLKLTEIVVLDETTARRAAAIRYAARSRRAGTIDAIVVASADHVQDTVIFTTDPHDLRPLVAVTERSLVKAF